MADVVFALLLIGFFAVAFGLVVACDRLSRRDGELADRIVPRVGPRDDR